MMAATEQTQKEAPPLAWIEDAKRRGEAIVKESERRRSQTSYSKETVIANKKLTEMLDS